MDLLDRRLATVLQIRTVITAQMFELQQLRRRVLVAQLYSQDGEGERDHDRAFRSLKAASVGGFFVSRSLYMPMQRE
jgi:hypothetical protein